MDAAKEAIDGLAKAIDLEAELMSLYKRAGDESPDEARRNQFYRFEENHQIHRERLEAERERLHRLHGDGFFSGAITSFVDALRQVVAGLPEAFIHGETYPTFETLVRCEQHLIALYAALRATVDAQTVIAIDAAIDDCNANISRLHDMDSLYKQSNT